MEFDEHDYQEKSVESAEIWKQKKRRSSRHCGDHMKEGGGEDGASRRSRAEEQQNGEKVDREARDRSPRREKDRRRRSRVADRERDKDRDHRSRERDQRERDKGKGKGKERARDKKRERENERDREKDKKIMREGEGEREKQRERERESEGERERERRSSNRARRHDREVETEMETARRYDREVETEMETARRHDREVEAEMERARNRERALRERELERELRERESKRFKEKKQVVEPETDPESDQRTVSDSQVRNIMPRKRFKGIDFQHSQAKLSNLPHEPEQLDDPQQSLQHWTGSSSTQQPDEPYHEPPTDDRNDEVVVGDFQIQDDQGRVRTRRGPTRARDIWQLREGERIIVTCNSFGQPIKKSASLLGSFIGTVARKCQLCPINYARWNEMIPSYKIELLRVVQSKFVLPPESHDWVLKSLNRKWKEHKARLKKDYKKEGMTEEEVARTCPPDVYPHQWIELVHYWFSERGQIYSNIGKAARSSQLVPHTSGSKSYARRRAEFMEEHGREPGEIEFYKMTHSHRDGNFVREESRDLIDRATTLITERVGNSSSSAECNRVEVQVFAELMGPERYGRVRGYGVGVTPTQLSAVSRYTQNCRQSNSIAEVCRLETQVQEMRQNHDAQLYEMRQSHDVMRQSYDLKIKQLSQSHQTEIKSLKTQIDQITSFLRDLAPHQAPDSSSSGDDDDAIMHK